MRWFPHAHHPFLHVCGGLEHSKLSPIRLDWPLWIQFWYETDLKKKKLANICRVYNLFIYIYFFLQGIMTYLHDFSHFLALHLFYFLLDIHHAIIFLFFILHLYFPPLLFSLGQCNSRIIGIGRYKVVHIYHEMSTIGSDCEWGGQYACKVTYL